MIFNCHLCVVSNRWYFGDIKRVAAEKLLTSEINGEGSFMVRKSESRPGEYALSVRDQAGVKHYRIRHKDNGDLFFAQNAAFSTLPRLIKHHEEHLDGLCINLKTPCVTVSINKFCVVIKYLFLFLI